MMCSVNRTLWIVIHLQNIYNNVHVECHSTRRNIFCSVEMFSLQTPCAFANQIPGICLYVVYVLAFDKQMWTVSHHPVILGEYPEMVDQISPSHR